VTIKDRGRAALRRGADALLWVARRRATIVGEEASTRSCLVFAPHPDDETLGCGALVARRTRAGAQVHVVVATDGCNSFSSARLTPAELAAVRHHEVLAALATLGVDPEKVGFLGFEDGSLAEHLGALVERVGGVIDRVDADDLVVPFVVDGHPDHRALATAVREHLQRSDHRGRVLAYPVWLGQRDAWTAGRHGTSVLGEAMSRFADVVARVPTEIVVDPMAARAKRQAADCHRSQLTNLTGEPDWPTLRPRDLQRLLRDEEVYFVVRGTPGATVR